MAVKKAPSEPAPADNTRTWLLLILALAAILRLYALGTTPHGFYGDEAVDGNNARQAIETGWQVFYPENNGREGLYINLSTPFVWALGNTILAMRLPSAIFGILTVWIVYLLGTRLFSRGTGLLAAFFMATSTWALHTSRLTHRASAAVFFLTLAVYLLLGVFQRMRDARPFVGLALLAGAVYGLGFHTYITYRATPLVVGGLWVYYLVLAWREGWGKRWLASAACFWSVAAIVVAPLVFYFVSHPETLTKRTAQVSALSLPHPVQYMLNNCWATAQMFFWRGDANWRHNIADRRELFLPVAVLFAWGLVIVGAAIFRRKRYAFAGGLLLVWLMAGALPSVLSVDDIHAFRTAQMIPAVFLVAALGAEGVWSALGRVLPQGLRGAAAGLFCVLLVCEPVQAYFVDWAHDENVAKWFDAWLVDAAAEIREAPAKPTKYIAIPMAEGEIEGGVSVYLHPIAYLTNSYTPGGQQAGNIRYAVQSNSDRIRREEFCDHVRTEHPDAQVFCLDYSPKQLGPGSPMRR